MIGTETAVRVKTPRRSQAKRAADRLRKLAKIDAAKNYKLDLWYFAHDTLNEVRDFKLAPELLAKASALFGGDENIETATIEEMEAVLDELLSNLTPSRGERGVWRWRRRPPTLEEIDCANAYGWLEEVRDVVTIGGGAHRWAHRGAMVCSSSFNRSLIALKAGMSRAEAIEDLTDALNYVTHHWGKVVSAEDASHPEKYL